MESSNEAASIVPSQAVGGFPQGSSVENDGSLSYRIPIEVPPGRAGVQPDLALVYASGVGNGIAGVGWTLAGSSEIHRCGTRVARDGTSRSDGDA